MREYYNMQVQEKHMKDESEKSIDNEQAKIFQIDTKRFAEQEKEINNRVMILFIFVYFFLG